MDYLAAVKNDKMVVFLPESYWFEKDPDYSVQLYRRYCFNYTCDQMSEKAIAGMRSTFSYQKQFFTGC